MHLPSLVQTGVIGFFMVGLSMGGKLIVADVSLSLRLGSSLNPIISLSGKIQVSSSVFWIMFQLSLIHWLTFGFLGLKVVTMTGLSESGLMFTSRNWS